MNESVSLEQLRVDFFVSGIQRHWAEAEESSDIYDHVYAVCTTIEAFWWMRIGVQVQWLDGARVDDSFRQHSYRLKQAEREFLKSWSYLVDQEVLDTVIESVSRKSLVSTRGAVQIEGADLLHGAFQAAVLLGRRFDQRSAAKKVVLALDIADARTWERILAQHVSADRIVESGREEDWSCLLNIDAVLAGFVYAVEYMKENIDLFDDGQRPARLTREAWLWLRASVVKGRKWRFSWGNLVPRERFLRLAEIAARKVAEELRQAGYSSDEIVFVQYTREVIDGWSSLEHLSAAAG